MSSVAGSPGQQPLHMRQSVRVRITLAAVVVTTVAVGAASWLLVRSVEDTQIAQLRDEINGQLDEVTARLEAGDHPQAAVQVGVPTARLVQVRDERGTTVAAAPTFLQNGQRVVIQFDDDGTVSRFDEGPPDAAGERRSTVTHRVVEDAPPSRGSEAVEGSGREGPKVLATSELGLRPFETLTRTVDTPNGTLTVAAAAPVEPVERSLAALRRALVVGLPALVVMVAAIAWVLVGRALRPVEAIRTEVDEITGSTMHRRVPEPPTGDEIGRLARTMNAMLARLDRASSRQRQFVSDASHELRSPVAAIRTGLEVARRNPDRANWPAVADTALAEESRLEALLDDLLLLAAQDENGGTTSDRKPVNLAAVVAAEAERPRQVPVQVALGSDPTRSAGDPGAIGEPDTGSAGGRDATYQAGPDGTDAGGGRSLEPDRAEALVVPGAADQLARVVSNLLDNAAHYATSAVEVRLVRDGDTVRLTVDDDGPGIPEEDRERVFERFTRLDDSRARDRGGSGLGLAVVRSIVTRHHGQVLIDDSPLGGARFVVDLPT